MKKIQGVLSIADESPSVNQGIVTFLKKLGEVAFQMLEPKFSTSTWWLWKLAEEGHMP